jgi:hypothetical protein
MTRAAIVAVVAMSCSGQGSAAIDDAAAGSAAPCPDAHQTEDAAASPVDAGADASAVECSGGVTLSVWVREFGPGNQELSCSSSLHMDTSSHYAVNMTDCKQLQPAEQRQGTYRFETHLLAGLPGEVYITGFGSPGDAVPRNHTVVISAQECFDGAAVRYVSVWRRFVTSFLEVPNGRDAGARIAHR